jgi:shikimate dehydrogenase
VTNLLSISTKTQFCAVIGNPVAHSLSPAIHNAAFSALGLDFVYVACQVEDVESALRGMRALGNFRGLSVTIPHKIVAAQLVDEINNVDRAIGAINTIIHEGNKLIGYGTDGPGARQALREAGVDLHGKRVLMLGAGGAARAIAFTLVSAGDLQELTLLDVNDGLRHGLAADLAKGTQVKISNASLTEVTLSAAMEQADILIHCTPVGMHPKVDASLVPPDLFRPEQVVFDIVYTPLQTKLVAEAKARGCKTISGVEMFANQAALQFELFTGVKAPLEVMRAVLVEKLEQ